MKYVIVGNGIIALSTAFRLMRRVNTTDSITIIGPTIRPGAATLAAAAMLNSFAEISAYSLRSDFDRYHFELSRQAATAWPLFEQELMDVAHDALSSEERKNNVLSRGAADRGTYIVNNTAADNWDDRNFDAMVQTLVEFKEPFEYVKPTDIPNYLPAQALRATRAAYIKNEGWLNPRRVLQALDNILQHGDLVTRIDAKAKRLVKRADTVSAVELDSGDRVEGDVFLVANGASASALLNVKDVGIRMQPVFYGIGVSLEIKAVGHPHTKCIRTPNRGGACGIYTAPLFLGPDQPEDHIVIGASNRVIHQPTHFGRIGSIAHLMHGAIQEINGYFYAAELIRVNVGWRPTTQDTYPLLGQTSIENLHVATGTKRDGFHLSPVLSEIMASLMMGSSPKDKRFGWYAPEREVIRDIPRKDAVDMIVASLMSEQYQHGFVSSNVLLTAQIQETYRKDIEALHDKVGAKDWGIPPELVKMYQQGHAR